MKIKWILCFVSLFFVHTVFAQTLPVGLLKNIDDNFRRQQLLGNDTSNSSFMIRPIFINKINMNLSDDPDAKNLQDWNKLLWQNARGNGELRLLPIVWQQQYTTHHPYSMNDGAMIPSKGYETLFSAGVYAKLGPLSIQLRPEFVFAENANYVLMSQINNGAAFFKEYRGYIGSIDQPERFGNGHYQKLNWGQSSIRLNFGPASIGLSNENLWWGPGIRSSLLMSNNADGFKHLTLNTTRPVKTPIGSFETQIIAGRLEASGIQPAKSLNLPNKSSDWRYLSAIVFVYQPKWVPNLFLGFDRSFTIYRKQMGNGFFDYFPIFSAVAKRNYPYSFDTNTTTEDDVPRDQRLSLFARWVMPESKSEIYVQYGKNDHNYDLRDVISEPEHSRAYVAGFRKLVPLTNPDTYIQVGLEVTQLEAAGTKNIRGAAYFYNNRQVQGYTNNGQVMGAAIGSGSDMQSLDVSWVNGLKRIGLQFERIVQNNGLMYRSVNDTRRHWIDLGVTGKLDWDYKGFILNGELAYIRSLNYQYRFENQQAFYWDWDKQDVNNLQLKVGLLYRW